jgi:hypothetical protein
MFTFPNSHRDPHGLQISLGWFSLLTLTFMSEWELADVWFDYEMCIRVPTKDKLCDKPLKTGLLKDVGMWYGRKLKANKNGMCWNNEGLLLAMAIS